MRGTLVTESEFSRNPREFKNVLSGCKKCNKIFSNLSLYQRTCGI